MGGVRCAMDNGQWAVGNGCSVLGDTGIYSTPWLTYMFEKSCQVYSSVWLTAGGTLVFDIEDRGTGDCCLIFNLALV